MILRDDASASRHVLVSREGKDVEARSPFIGIDGIVGHERIANLHLTIHVHKRVGIRRSCVLGNNGRVASIGTHLVSIVVSCALSSIHVELIRLVINVVQAKVSKVLINVGVSNLCRIGYVATIWEININRAVLDVSICCWVVFDAPSTV